MRPIVLTTGEPAGIGVDITLMLAQQPWPAVVVVLADQRLLAQRAAELGMIIHCEPYQGQTRPARAAHLYVQQVDLRAPVVAGELNPANAPYVLDQLQQAAQACLSGQAAAVVTAPVQKSVINDAGVPFSGHTEFFAEAAGVDLVVMMLATSRLRVALATTHLPLRAVPDALTPDLLRRVLQITLQDLQEKFGLARPVLKVCGLNPHAGEGGHLGREELEVIEPVLAEFRAAGHAVGHALPADTLFTAQGLGGADAVLAMYHDQGLPVLKSQGFGEAINITLGLPFIRTSVDHGTALSLAGTGHAQSGSLQRALEVALELVQRQNVRTAPHGEVQS